MATCTSQAVISRLVTANNPTSPNPPKTRYPSPAAEFVLKSFHWENSKMKFALMPNIRATLLLCAAILFPSAAPLAAQAPAAQSPAAQASRPAPARRVNNSFRPRGRHLIYVALPGSLERPGWANGTGIVVLDADNNYQFVKRIPTWDYAGSMSPEQVSGMAASPVTNLIYVAARGRLGAIDMGTDKMVWSVTLDGNCCERPQVTPDGKIVVVGGDLQDYWYEVDAKTGRLIGKLDAPQSPNSHNLNLSADGKTAFMSPNNKVMTISDVASRRIIKTIPFPDNIRVFVLNKDSSKIYANNNNFDGFLIADVASGKVIKKVEVTSVDWKSKWFVTPTPRIPHGCPSHGIALTPDEKEIWLADGVFKTIHIFSNTEDPKEIDTISTPNGTYWLTFGLDGKLAYSSSGDIIDVKTHKVIGQMKDEYGRTMFSEKLLDITFDNGHAQRVSNQFANSFGDYLTAEQLGVGPHVTPVPGSAPITLTGVTSSGEQ
jgi:DNA-binding beta-propeller fold protein YncE